MELLPFTLSDKTTFEQYLRKKEHSLSSYSFENVWAWRVLFELRWMMTNEKFCLFFKNETGCFMNLPPLGGLEEETIERCFEVMQKFNDNGEVSRIENVEEDDLSFFKDRGFRFYEKAQEYIVSRRDISTYKGEKFKDKRNLCNFFVKNYSHKFRQYRREDRNEVIVLYKDWMLERMSKNNDAMYLSMLQDSLKVLSKLLDYAGTLNLCAWVVESQGKIKAFTSGFPINRDMFCINFEVTDLKMKGLAQFIFREFAKMLCPYSEINIMDDSYIENIRRTKLSFRPQRGVSTYTVLMKA